jgi:hypothetical protein
MREHEVELAIVGVGQPDMPSAPKNLQITFRTPEDAEVRWLPPLSAVRVDHYKVACGCVFPSVF